MNKSELLEYFATHINSDKRSVLEISRRTHSTRKNIINAQQEFRKNKAYYIDKYKGYKGKRKVQLPKILIMDIETSPIKAFVWKLWKENVSLDQIIDDWFIICWSAKWLNSNEVMGECLTKEEVLKEDDKRITLELWKLFNEADIIVAHNGGKFDIPKTNVRFLYHGLVPPAPYKIVDTLQVAKKQFNFSSNKLDALAEFFGFDRKLDTDFTLWKECLEGKQAALDYMFKYNKYDVELLEEVYLKLLPWTKGHPNIANYIQGEDIVCSNCGSLDTKLIPNKYYKTQVGTYELYRCKHCGAISRRRKTVQQSPQTISIT